MATAYVSFGRAGHFSSGHQPVFTGPIRTVTVTTSETAANTAINAGVGEVARITADGNIIATAFGTATASGTRNGVYIASGETEWIGCQDGQPISIIDA